MLMWHLWVDPNLHSHKQVIIDLEELAFNPLRVDVAHFLFYAYKICIKAH